MSEYFAGQPSEPPLFWLRGRAVYAIHFLILVLVASMVATSLVDAFNLQARLFTPLAFDSIDVLRGQVWRLVSYEFINEPSLQFAINMLALFLFGPDVERFIGRTKVLWLALCLGIFPALVLTAMGLVHPVAYAGETISFSLFVAFATLNPNVELMFGVLAKWAALILIGIFTLADLAYHSLTSLVVLWSECAVAFLYVRCLQGHISLPDLRFWRRRPKLRVLPDLEPMVRVGDRRKDPSMDEVDALLDKIAKSGISSLTARERARLDAARDDLLKKKEAGR